ncbi:MAG: sulfatase [Pirellulaceae bacterium]|nr:sulfatase [Pirellulaceae bacterium]
MQRSHTLIDILHISAVFAVGVSTASSIALAEKNNPTKPNIIVILADDLGWTDLACFGSDFYETPHLDAFAASGMKFTQNYSACTVCSPTRAALMTGKYPAKLHVTDWIPGQMPDNPKLLVPDWTKYLSHSEMTIAEVLRSAGYSTASIGKWHLGNQEYYPETHGFDLNIAGTDKPAPSTFFAPWKIATLSDGAKGDYLTDRLADEAIEYIEQHRDQPFFLYLPHFAVHTPIQGPVDLVEKYREKLQPHHRHRNVEYAAMVESLDIAVGRVLAKLRDLQLDDHTIVIFTSDNGGRITSRTTTNEPLRFGKASAYEGGVRVPMIIRWPEVTQAGSVSDTPVITMDLFPTVLDMARAIKPQSTLPNSALEIDGVSLTPLLRAAGNLAERDLYWHYPHHQHYQLGGTMPYAAIRSGNYKLIEFYNDRHVELYNLKDDIGEKNNLVESEPELTDRLRVRLHGWQSNIGAQMPTSNANYDSTKPEYNPAPAKN